MSLLPPFPSFNVLEDASSVGPRCFKGVTRFDNFLLAFNFKDPAQSKGMLLHYAGKEVCDKYETLPAAMAMVDSTSTTGWDIYKLLVEQLTTHLDPKVNYEYQHCTFRQERQHADKSIDTFHNKILHIAMLAWIHRPGCGTQIAYSPNLLFTNVTTQVTPQTEHAGDEVTQACTYHGDV